MQLNKYDDIGESMYSATLQNGLRLRVIPKPGFSTAYAVFATNYGGAHRRFTVDGQTLDTPAGVAHFLEHKMFDLPEGENAAVIGSVSARYPGKLVMNTAFGGSRILQKLTGAQLPRIC